MDPHTSDQELRQYVDGLLEPGALLAVDDHLAQCQTCRARSMRFRDGVKTLSRLQSGFTGPEAHLSEEDIQACALGSSSATLEAHLRDCAMCAGQVADLRSFLKVEAPPLVQGMRRYAVAAALFIALITGLLIWQRPAPSPAETPNSLAGIESLPPSHQQQVRNAMHRGVVDLPQVLAEMGSGQDVLMGETNRGRFHLITPIRTVTVLDRPAFRWESLPGASAYTVEVFDPSGSSVMRSGALSATEWTPPSALARGRTFVWQVTARVGETDVTEPAPPSPMAMFRILDAESAAVLQETAARWPDSHLLLGILHAQAGVRGEAQRHLQRVTPTDPHAAVARATLEKLQ